MRQGLGLISYRARMIDMSLFSSGLGGLLGGLFGNSGKPYGRAMDQYQKWLNEAKATQQPYLNAGATAIPEYQSWLKNMQNPSEFVNGLMQNYQESPYTRYLQQQAQNAGINSGSASGLTGSSALAQQMQQNAANIGQQGLDAWLQNVLGLNTMYGQGQQAGRQADLFNTIGGGLGMLSGLGFL